MQARPRPATLDPSDRGAVAALRSALGSRGYDAQRLRTLLRAEGDNLTPRAGDIPIVERLLPRGDPLSALVRLFLIGRPVSERDAAAALAPLTIDAAVSIGILERQPEQVIATVRLVPAEDLVFACDLALESAPDLPADHVMGVTTSSLTLAHATIRRNVGSVLDVGTGCGVQAVFAARHAARVIACDINPRALNFAAFNAVLNGVTNMECRRGSFFDPVGTERFDLIVSNPPFVISPEGGLTFRDAGMRGDAVSRSMVRGAASHLTEGGLAFVLVSWGVSDGADWVAPLREWTADIGCDALFLQHTRESAMGYAASWNAPLQSQPERYAATVDRWLAYLTALNFASVSYGTSILRRRAGENWLRAEEVTAPRASDAGPRIAALIATQDLLAGLTSDAPLLDARPRLDPAHRLDQTLRARRSAFVVDSAVLRLESGLRFEAAVDAFIAHLLARLDGTVRLRDAIRDTVVQLDAGPDELESACLPIIRRLLALGFLTVETS
ncbi:MAG TPA: methyltransferase [Candidatus Limnocylindria bacterium]|nr:methyltransferase [Candidatus Limnocylindria bacterium]